MAISNDTNFSNEKDFVRALAAHIKEADRSFILSSLALINTDERRKKMIKYIKDHPDASKKDLDEKMFYISIGKDYDSGDSE